MTARQRACRACGGSGESTSCGALHGLSACRQHDCCRCEQPREYINADPCPACLGTGVVSDPSGEQARRDALADAETLRLAACDCDDTVRDNLKVAATWGTGWRRKERRLGSGEVVTPAILAARAAFRACPGLRG